MLTNDITLNTSDIFSLVSTKGNSSLRSDAARPLETPRYMTISHETNAKSGKVSSVVMFDSEEVLPVSVTGETQPIVDNIRVMLKVQYSPLSGRTTTQAELDYFRTILAEFAANASNWDKFLNKEI